MDPGGPATPVGLEDPATPVGLEDPATPVGLVDPAGRVTVVDPGDMNRVVAATVGTAAAMALADLASQVVPVVRVDPERLVVPNPVARVEPGNREATDLSLGRVLLGQMPMRRVRMPARPVRMPMRQHLTAARPVLMPALLHLTPADRRTPVDRRRDPTIRAVATCQEATRAVATRAVATRRAGRLSSGTISRPD